MGLAVPYRQRHPERTAFYQCLENYWEEFKESYRYFYERAYGSLRPVVDKTVDRFSECGIFRHGFARIRCRECRKGTVKLAGAKRFRDGKAPGLP